jgi:cephalosporin-C deacetylase-like acetyl esterase
MVNYGADQEFDRISMVGLSGGGWTTTLAAAVDPRIEYSFPVAGTYPMFIKLEKPKKNYGDFEQSYPPLYKEVNYLDMYILGAVGKNRLQLQLLNLQDPCCFDGKDFEKYESVIKTRVGKFTAGRFDIFSDTANTQHSISQIALEEIFKSFD